LHDVNESDLATPGLAVGAGCHRALGREQYPKPGPPAGAYYFPLRVQSCVEFT
jgi:hypothetical protein